VADEVDEEKLQKEKHLKMYSTAWRSWGSLRTMLELYYYMTPDWTRWQKCCITKRDTVKKPEKQVSSSLAELVTQELKNLSKENARPINDIQRIGKGFSKEGWAWKRRKNLNVN